MASIALCFVSGFTVIASNSFSAGEPSPTFFPVDDKSGMNLLRASTLRRSNSFSGRVNFLLPLLMLFVRSLRLSNSFFVPSVRPAFTSSKRAATLISSFATARLEMFVSGNFCLTNSFAASAASFATTAGSLVLIVLSIEPIFGLLVNSSRRSSANMEPSSIIFSYNFSVISSKT